MSTKQNEYSQEEICEIIADNGTWIKLTGLANIIFGVFACLTLIGALIGIPMIMSGTRLWKSVNAAKKGELKTSVKGLQLHFLITGILMLIQLIAIGFSFITMGGLMISMMMR